MTSFLSILVDPEARERAWQNMVGQVFTGKDLVAAYDAEAVLVLSPRLKELGQGRYKVQKLLPTKEEYAALKVTQHGKRLDQVVPEAFEVLQAVADKLGVFANIDSNRKLADLRKQVADEMASIANQVPTVPEELAGIPVDSVRLAKQVGTRLDHLIAQFEDTRWSLGRACELLEEHTSTAASKLLQALRQASAACSRAFNEDLLNATRRRVKSRRHSLEPYA